MVIFSCQDTILVPGSDQYFGKRVRQSRRPGGTSPGNMFMAAPGGGSGFIGTRAARGTGGRERERICGTQNSDWVQAATRYTRLNINTSVFCIEARPILQVKTKIHRNTSNLGTYDLLLSVDNRKKPFCFPFWWQFPYGSRVKEAVLVWSRQWRRVLLSPAAGGVSGRVVSVGTSECSSGVVTARPARRVLSGEPTPGQAASVTQWQAVTLT